MALVWELVVVEVRTYSAAVTVRRLFIVDSIYYIGYYGGGGGGAIYGAAYGGGGEYGIHGYVVLSSS
jgi:hypothetical protein